MAAASTSPAAERARGVPLAADVIAVLAGEHVEAPHLHVAPRLEARLGEQQERDQRRLRRVGRAHADTLPRRSAIAWIGAPSRTTTSEVRSRSVSRMAIASALRARRARGAVGLDPRERRVPRDVEMAAEVGLDLGFVVSVEDEVEGQVVREEPALEALPDRDDLRIVGDGAEDERSVGHGPRILSGPSAARQAGPPGHRAGAARAHGPRRQGRGFRSAASSARRSSNVIAPSRMRVRRRSSATSSTSSS